jgi:hypothetical protein
MKKNKWNKIILFSAVSLVILSSLSPAQELIKHYEHNDDFEHIPINTILPQQLKNTITPGEINIGEVLDPDCYGPGYIEHMNDCITRDMVLRSDKEIEGENKQHGTWIIPSREATYYPYSGTHYVTNKWGDTQMGITFPTNVNVHGAWFAGQGGGIGVWARGIRVIGYQNGMETTITDWFEDIDDSPTWFSMNLKNVDRISIEAVPVFNNAGWYGMDDLTFSPVRKNGYEPATSIVIDFEDCSYNENLNESMYTDLIWEIGTGTFYNDQEKTPSDRKTSNTNQKHVYHFENSYGLTRFSNGNNTPALLTDYQGVIRGDATSWSYPPDSCGAAGPNHFVEVVNRNFAVYNKSSGDEVINILLRSFLPGCNGDPRVLYDQYSDRWFIIVCDFISRLFLAVSMSDDPTGDWFKCDFIVSQGSDAGKWPDYPTLGVDKDGVYTAAYMIGGSNGMSIFALDKAPLIAPEPSLGTVVAYRELPWEGAIQPVHTFNTSHGEYFVSRMSSTGIRVRRLTNLTTNPTLTELGSVTIPSHSSPPDAPALGSTTPLDTVGHRLMNAVYRDGYIWTAHCIAVDGRAASRWYKINAHNVSLADYGTIKDSVMYYFFPTIMVNADGDAIMGFSGSHAGQYGAAYYTGRSASDPPGEMAPPILLKEGEATYNLIDSYGRNRWGDYSLCSLDPINYTFWTIQEYAHAHNASGENRWGTWIGEIDFNRPPEPPNGASGPDEGVTNIEYTFTAETTDPEEDQIYYKFNWGDGEDSGWVGPYKSGQTGSASHSWKTAGNFSIKVKAKDNFSESNWSPEHTITIIGGPKLEIGVIRGGLFNVKTDIKNTGATEASNINWTITLDGGTFIGRETTGTIDCISPDNEKTISSNILFGIGPTIVTVTSEISEGADIREQTGYIFLIFIKVNPGGAS